MDATTPTPTDACLLPPPPLRGRRIRLEAGAAPRLRGGRNAAPWAPLPPQAAADAAPAA